MLKQFLEYLCLALVIYLAIFAATFVWLFAGEVWRVGRERRKKKFRP